jgi:hypothetical protein
MSKLPKATHKGDLKLVGIQIPCYVLEDGRRVLYQRGIIPALGMGRGASRYGRGDRLAIFMSGKVVSDYASKELREVTKSPFKFLTDRGTVAYGYEATTLVEICDAVVEARNSGRLQKQQMHIAARCEVLLRAFAKVGIIALVDEATGYQQERNREELQKILAAYIAPELMPYTARFPEEFWKNMFRLRGWQYHTLASGKGAPKGPRYAGKLTDELIYKKLPPGVREELRKKSPSNEKYQRRHKLYRFLTEDVGDPHLEKQVAIVTTLMKVSNSWRAFLGLFERAFADPNAGVQVSLFPEDDEEDNQ